MNRKTIKAILTKKFNEWLESIDDEVVKSKVKTNTIITGGCITSMFLGEPVNDFDLYFTDKETTKAVAEYYVRKFNEKNGKHSNKCGFNHSAFVIDGALPIAEQIKLAGEDVWDTGMLQQIPEDRIKIIVRSDGVASEDESDQTHYDIIDDADEINEAELDQEDTGEKYRPIFLSTNAITLSNKVQIVVRFHGKPEEIHSNFDFVHCTNYWTSDDSQLYTSTEALESILSKTLRYNGSKYPLCSIIRTRKFIKRGWHINAGQYLKMAFQLNELNLNDVTVLEEQLVGVDTLYFMSMIDQIKRRQQNDPDFKFDSCYVCSIIDKIF